MPGCVYDRGMDVKITLHLADEFWGFSYDPEYFSDDAAVLELMVEDVSAALEAACYQVVREGVEGEKYKVDFHGKVSLAVTDGQ